VTAAQRQPRCLSVILFQVIITESRKISINLDLISYRVFQKNNSDQVRLEMAIHESMKLSEKEQPTSKPTLVDLSAAAKTLQDPWGGKTSRQLCFL